MQIFLKVSSPLRELTFEISTDIVFLCYCILLSSIALLLPPDRTKKECVLGLRQPGLDLLSRHLADPSDGEEETEKKSLSYEGSCWGRPYKELRGRKKAKYIRLSTGRVKVQPKTDCWLTFHEYLKLTE